MYIGNNNVEKLYIGSTEVDKVYLGTDVVYEKASPGPNIHLTDDGMGIVFPAGTYTNTDGYMDFTIEGPSGSTQSDSITFDTDITFPSHNSSETVRERYTWRESNVDTINPQITRFTMYDGGGQNYGNSFSFDSTTASGILSTRYGFCSGSSERYINNDSYSYCYGYYDSAYNAYPNYGDSYGGYVSGFECRITHTVGRAIELPQEKIYIALRSGGSQITAANVSGRIDTTKSYLGVYSSTTSSFVKQWYSTGANSSGYLTFNFGSDTDYTLNENEYYVLRIVFSTKLSALYSSQTGGVNQLNLTKWGYQVMTPKIVKLGLSGHIMDYSPDFVDKRIMLGEDTRPGWNLGYVQFSGTEEDKLVQYSTTPIT